MNIIGAGPIQQTTSQTISPYSPLGKPAVGLESADTKDRPLPPVEETSNAAKPENQNAGQRAKAVSGDSEEGRQQQGRPSLDEAEVKQVRELATRDREVRAHEAAHSAVGGALAGGPSFRYVKGPDGVSYAVSGEVSISLGTIANDPQQTLRNAEQVRAAALAPAQPSPQDLHVAAAATQIAMQARVDIVAERAAATAAPRADAAKTKASGPTVASSRGANAYSAPPSRPGSLLDQTV